MLHGNRFLNALPPDVAEALTGGEQPRELAFGATIVRRGDVQERLHFPTAGAISDIEEQPDGGASETGAIGPEGVSGFEVFLGVPNALVTRIIQTPTHAFAVPAERAIAARDRHAALDVLSRRYAAAMLRAGGINIACNARHAATRRLARWLLRMADRLRSDDVQLTHDATALMLGVRRATVTHAMHALQRAGAIGAARGGVRIIDRAILEDAACTCYAEECAVYEALYA